MNWTQQLGTLFSGRRKSKKSRRSPRPANHRHRRFSMEQLEDRRLLAVTANLYDSGEVLQTGGYGFYEHEDLRDVKYSPAALGPLAVGHRDRGQGLPPNDEFYLAVPGSDGLPIVQTSRGFFDYEFGTGLPVARQDILEGVVLRDLSPNLAQFAAVGHSSGGLTNESDFAVLVGTVSGNVIMVTQQLRIDLFNSGTNDVAYDVTFDNLGRIVVVGTTDADGEQDFAILRLVNQFGTFQRDATFGPNGDGVVVTDVGIGEEARGVEVDLLGPLGKINVGGFVQSPPPDRDNFVWVRYNDDGSVDAPTPRYVTFGDLDRAYDLALDSQQRVILAGWTSVNQDFAIARFINNDLLPNDGQLDTTFDGDGLRTVDFGGNEQGDGGLGYGVQVNDPYDRITVVGKTTAPFGTGDNGAIVRLLENGWLDSNYGLQRPGRTYIDFTHTDLQPGEICGTSHITNERLAGVGVVTTSFTTTSTTFLQAVAGVTDYDHSMADPPNEDKTGTDHVAGAMLLGHASFVAAPNFAPSIAKLRVRPYLDNDRQYLSALGVFDRNGYDDIVSVQFFEQVGANLIPIGPPTTNDPNPDVTPRDGFEIEIQGTRLGRTFVAIATDSFGEQSQPVSVVEQGPPAPAMGVIGVSHMGQLNFGTVDIGDPPPTREIQILNYGEVELLIYPSDVPAPFEAVPTLANPISIAPCSSVTLTFRMNTNLGGDHEGEMYFSTNDPNQPLFEFTLVGTVRAPDVTVLGNNNSIPDNDTTPSTTDLTHFGVVVQYSTPVIHTFTVRNDGDLDLILSDLAVPDGYSIVEPLASMLAPGASDTFDVRLNTAVVGVKTGDISFTTNVPNEDPYNFRITGQVAAGFAEITVRGNNDYIIADGDTSPSTLEGTYFGTATQGSSIIDRNFTVSNSGNANLVLGSVSLPPGFSIIDSLASSIPPGGSDVMRIRLNPALRGNFSGDVSFTTNDADENPFNFRISGSVVGPEIDVTGNTFGIADGDFTPSFVDFTDFGTASQGTDVTRSYLVRNGAGTSLIGLDLFSVSVPSGFEVIDPLVSYLAPGASDFFTVRLDTSTAGTKSGQIFIYNSDYDENPYNFSITGTVTTAFPEVSVSGNSVNIADGDLTPSTADGTDFGTVTLGGSTVSRSFVVRNDGSAPLALNDPSVPAGFSITDNLVSTLAPGASDTFTVRLDSAVAGTKSGPISFGTNDADENPFNFNITGSVGSPEVTVTGSGLNISDGDLSPSTSDGTDFGSISVGGAPVSKSFVVRNDGNVTLTLSNLSVPTGFSITDNLLGSLAPGASDTFTVRLDSAIVGAKSGPITFITNDADENPFNFSIQGVVNAVAQVDLSGWWVLINNPTRQWGDVVHLDRISVRNAGISPSGPFALEFYLSRDTTGSPDDFLLAQPNGNSSHAHGSLGGNTYGPYFELDLQLPPGPPSGYTGTAFYVVMKTDAFDDVAETNENNNFGNLGSTYDYYPVTITSPPANQPEITVLGNGISIADGDLSPSTTDGTDFGSVVQGGATISKSFTVRNDGDATLTLSSLSVPTGYSIADSLVGSLAPGAADTLTVRLDSAVVGTKSGQITFTTNDADENPFNFSVTGAVGAPEVTVTGNGFNISDGDTSPTTSDGTDFGSVTLGGATVSKVFVVRNDGNATLTLSNLSVPAGYSITDALVSSLAPGATDTFTVRLDTTVVGTKSGQINFTTNDSNENPFNFNITGVVAAAEVTVTGNGINISDGDPSPTTADGTDFGVVNQGAPGISRSFVVRNDGNATLTLSGLSVPTGYTVTNGLVSSLAPGASDTFTVRLDSAVFGAKNGFISFNNNDADENPFNFYVTGAVFVPEVAVRGNGMNIVDGDVTPTVADHTDFGFVSVGDANVTRTFTVLNDGSAPLSLSGLVVPTGFTVTNGLVSSLAAGASDTITVQVDTSVATTRAGNIQFNSNDADENPFNFRISATILAPEVAVEWNTSPVIDVLDGDTTPSTTDGTDFGSISLNNMPVTHTFLVRNHGPGTLYLSNLSVPPGFTVVDGLAASVAPGNADLLTIRLDTAIAGTKTGQVSFTNNDSNENPFNFTIRGIVTAPEITVTGNGISIADGDTTPSTLDGTDFGLLALGSIAQRTFTVRNDGTANLQLTSLFYPSGFTLVDGLTSNLAPGASDTFTLQANTSALWTLGGVVSFNTNDADENPFNFVITATVSGPEVDVQANGGAGPLIADGDSTPSVADTTDFGGVFLGGATESRTFRVRNTGNATLTLGPLSAPAGFTITNGLVSSLAPNAFDDFVVRLDTAVRGTKSGQISFATNDSDENPFNFSITGDVVGPEVGVTGNGFTIVDNDTSPNTTDGTNFGSVAQGLPAVSRTFTISNTGDWSLQVGTVNVPAGFTVTDWPAGVIGAGSSDTFTVSMPTSVLGTKSGQISFTTNDADENPFNFSITGSVVGTGDVTVLGLNNSDIPDGAPSPTTANGTHFGTATLGGPGVTRTFTVRNDGTANLTLSGLTVPAGFTITNSLVSTLAPGGSDTFSVRLDASVAGTKSGQISFTTNDPDENPFNFAVSGMVSSSSGVTVQSVPYYQPFDSKPASTQGWEYDSTGFGRIDAVGGRLRMDSSYYGYYGLNEAILHVNLAGKSNVVLNLGHYRLGNESTTPLPLVFTGHANGDGVSLSADGVTWYHVATYYGDSPNGSWNLDSIVAGAGISYTSDFRIKFQQYDYFQAPSGGREWDNITITASGGTAPEATVLGGGYVINDGDTTPSTFDQTDLGNLQQGAMAYVSYTVRNDGTGALTTSGLTVPSGFSIVNGLASVIAPGGSDQIQLQIDTTTVGVKTGQLSFNTNDSDENPYNFTIRANVQGAATQADLSGWWVDAPGSGYWGQTINLQRVQVRNGGSGASGAFHIQFYLSRDPSGSADDILLSQTNGQTSLAQGSIAANSYGPMQQVALQLPSLPVGWSGTTFYIVMKVDAFNAVSETNENNNFGNLGQTYDWDVITIL